MSIVEINESNTDVFEDMMGPDLTADLEREFFRGLGALSEDGKPVGCLVYELKNKEEDVETKSEIMLITADDESIREELMDTYKASVRVEEVTESYYEMTDLEWGEFFQKAGFTNDQIEGSDIVITVGEFIESPVMKGRIPEHIGSIGSLVLRRFRKGITRFLFAGKKGLLEDLAYLPINWFDTEVSSYSEADGKVDGFLLVRHTPSGSLDVKLFIAAGPDSIINLVSMLRYSVRKASELYPPDTKIVMKRHNNETRAFTKKLFPNAKGAPAIKGERAEG